MAEQRGEMIVYRSSGGGSGAQLKAAGGTVWLSQRGIAGSYGTTVTNVNHIMRCIVDDGEVTEATIDSESIVRLEGTREVRRTVSVYNLEMILAVGYQVTTPQAVMFRQWETTVLKEFLTKGFVLDDERLKSPGSEPDCFDELLQIEHTKAKEKDGDT
ncbi:MAG: virulence RhuM family protein [Propionibacteriaceae bacterium]|jgi:hypothetical protein|nr:virulence RhuM family protein [Propionibacteriaceae bacterium]